MSLGPLEGIRVLDCGLLVQGPQAAATLCDMGAEVIKVELPGMGDPTRTLLLGTDDHRSAWFQSVNRGKKSITVDLRTPSGAEIFKGLSAKADVIVSNFKPGTMDAWGLGYNDLKRDNPKLIWAAGSAFGALGPDANREGADLAAQAAGGLVSTIGHDEQPPSPVGVTIADHIASQNLVAGILAALVSRGKSGKGQKIEGSLLGGQIWAQAAEYTYYLLTNKLPGRGGYGHPLLRGIYGLFETMDGWIGVIGVPSNVRDVFFTTLGVPELALDERFSGYIADKKDLDNLFDLLGNTFRTKTTDEWSEILESIGVRWSPVRDYSEVVDDPGAWENGYFQKVTDSQGEEYTAVGVPITLSETPMKVSGSIPSLGQHTDELLSDLGYSGKDIEGFRNEGSI